MARKPKALEPKIVKPADINSRNGERNAPDALLRSGESGPSLGTAAAGARPHAGRLRGARRFPAAARIPARAHAKLAREVQARRAAGVRPVQHALHLEHGNRRMGARQADTLVLLTGNGEPWVWDFGSAARHHKLYAPWLPTNHCLAGNVGLRGAINPRVGLFEEAAKEIKDILVKEGVADMPLGIDVVEPAVFVRAAEAGHQGAGRPAGDARSARNQEPRRDHASQHGRRHGRRRIPGYLRGVEAGRARKRNCCARDQALVRDGLGLRGSDQRDRRRALQPASAQLHRSHDTAGRSGVLRHHSVIHGLSHVLLPDLYRWQRHQTAN